MEAISELLVSSVLHLELMNRIDRRKEKELEEIQFYDNLYA